MQEEKKSKKRKREPDGNLDEWEKLPFPPDEDENFIYEYSGSVCRDEPGRRWVVKFTKPAVYKSFADAKFPSARQSAEHFRRITSNKRGKTIQRKQTDRIVDNDRKFVSGFFDGDGSISLSKGNTSFSVKIFFWQSNANGFPVLLQYIYNLYGGRLNKINKEHDKNWRQGYSLDFTAQGEVIPLLKHLEQHCIVKLPQVKMALDFLQHGDGFKGKISHSLYEAMKQAKLLENYRQVEIDEKRVTNTYVAGLFCADGTTGIYKRRKGYYNHVLAIAQKSSIRLLHAIKQHFKDVTSHVDTSVGSVRFDGKQQILYVINQIQPFVVGPKVRQLQIMKEWCELKCDGRWTDEQRSQIDKWVAELKRLKKT